MITTHRGRNTNFKENTIGAFDHALKLGSEAVECDLRLTLDNKVVVHHDKSVRVNDKKFFISKTPLKDLRNITKSDDALDKLPTLDELFDYINRKNVPFFLEVKSSSQILIEEIIAKIEKNNLWDRIYVIGFFFFIKTAVRLQKYYPKLKIMQLVSVPIYSYIKSPKPSFGIMFGWFDSWHGSEWLFKKVLSVKRLSRLHDYYKRNGFNKVFAGVINSEAGFKYFEEAGITDIVTDNVKGAVKYYKSKK